MDVFNIAIVGATGAVGEALVNILDERDFPVGELFLLASERSAGTRVMFRNKSILVTDLADFDFTRAHIGLFSAGGEVSAEYAPKAAAAGCIVIDNTSHFRYDADIPLVVPEVNGEALANFSERNIIANPNKSGALCIFHRLWSTEIAPQANWTRAIRCMLTAAVTC